MAQTLEFNKAVVNATAVIVPTFDEDMDIIQKLDDEPNDVGGLSAEQLKAEFDSAGNKTKAFINNELLPAIIAEELTEEARAAAEAERVANEQERVSNENERIASEEKRETEILKVENLTVEAATLPSDSVASAEVAVNEQTGGFNVKFGIPKGKDGEGTGDMSASTYDPNRVKAPVAFRPTYESTTMIASAWSGNTYSFEAEYPNAKYDVDIQVAPTATAEQFEAFGSAMICGSADSNVATALGDVPTVDVPIIVKAVAK